MKYNKKNLRTVLGACTIVAILSLNFHQVLAFGDNQEHCSTIIDGGELPEVVVECSGGSSGKCQSPGHDLTRLSPTKVCKFTGIQSDYCPSSYLK